MLRLDRLALERKAASEPKLAVSETLGEGKFVDHGRNGGYGQLCPQVVVVSRWQLSLFPPRRTTM